MGFKPVSGKMVALEIITSDLRMITEHMMAIRILIRRGVIKEMDVKDLLSAKIRSHNQRRSVKRRPRS
jgi:hypothetical protein